MKKLNVIIEQGADGFFAYVAEIDGCTAGGFTFSETKSNILSMIQVALNEDGALYAKYAKGYDVQFKISLEFVFNQFPELNIEGLAKETRIKQSVLKGIKDGTRMATEEEADTKYSNTSIRQKTSGCATDEVTFSEHSITAKYDRCRQNLIALVTCPIFDVNPVLNGIKRDLFIGDTWIRSICVDATG